MERKSDKVRRLVAEGNYRAALRIAKDFRLGITKEQSDIMKRGYECMTHASFYKSIGADIPKIIEKAQETVIQLYGI